MPSPDPSRTVTKRELILRIAEETGMKKTDVRVAVQHFLDAIGRELGDGNRLEFREFGVFEVKERAPRMARNPRTKQEVLVPSKRVVSFKAGRSLRERVQRSGGAANEAQADAASSATPTRAPAAPSGGKPHLGAHDSGQAERDAEAI